jgi:hypothetical protein
MCFGKYKNATTHTFHEVFFKIVNHSLYFDRLYIARTGYPWVKRPGCGVDHFTFKSSSSEAFSAPSWSVIGWTLPYFYLLTSISGCSRYNCFWFWFGRICCWLRYSAIVDTYVVGFDFRLLLISIYSRHTFMLLVAICIYFRHMSVVGCGIRLFQTHWWLWNSVVADTHMPLVGFAIELRRHINCLQSYRTAVWRLMFFGRVGNGP